ncbi:MAG: DUF2298 domain-containing protein [Dehalococcoidia bacterium]
MLDVARWYLALVAIGAGGLLPSTLLFGSLRSRGVLYARPLALLLVAYVVWLGGRVGILPYGTLAVLLALVLLWGWSAWLWWSRPALVEVVRGRQRLLLVGEALFLAVFVLIAFVRVQAPDAAFTEKPMDLMLLRTVHDTDRFPPADTWFGGEPVSYYHLGHTTVDIEARLSGIDVGVAFTLGVATAGALAAAAVFALAGDVLALGRRRDEAAYWAAGGIAVVLLLLVATLEGGLEVLAANGFGSASLWAHAGVEGFPPLEGATSGVPDGFWWWWRATRVLPGTITEFPAFSFILGDLHAHVMALPLAVLAVAVTLPAFDGSTPLTWRAWRRRPEALALSALLFAGLAMTNSWDAALYGAIWLGAGAAAYLATGWGHLGAIFGMLRHLIVPGILAAVLAWPFLSTLETVPLEVGVAGAGSDPLRLLLVWLPVLAPSIAAIVLLRPRIERGHLVTALVLASLPVAGWLLLAPAMGEGSAIGERGSGWLTLAALVAALGWSGGAAASAYRDGDRGRAAWLAALTAAGTIVLATELVYLVDAFGGRLNTVFKFWYGAWLLAAVAGGAAAGDALDLLRQERPGSTFQPHYRSPIEFVRRRGRAFGAGFVVASMGVVLFVALLYAPAAAISRGREGQPPALDATRFLALQAPDEAAAVAWARANLEDGDVLLEAVGQSYEQTNRISTMSGVPTVLAWPGHERQWRGRSEEIARREADVATIYELGATDEAATLARQYGVTYVVLGNEEARRYGGSMAERFAAWPVAFESGRLRIVAVPEEPAP